MKLKAFTLIEVLVVIVIIVILAVVSISYFLGFLTISKEAKVKKSVSFVVDHVVQI
jgi:prepilin-type N-terminal cleavage/methylation domain-containing protein